MSFNTFVYIEIGGTGGRAFRPMYAQFLKEASSILEKPGLREAAEIFEDSADAWSEIVRADLRQKIRQCHQIEEKAFKILSKYGKMKGGIKVRKVECDDILKKLRSLSNPKAVEGMAKYGINPKNAYGVSIPNLRKMAKEIKRNHLLAQQLWASSVHEARILATMVDDPKMMTDKQIEGWVRGFYSWDICDQCCNNLFKKTKFAYQKAVAWSSGEEEFVKRAGFVLMACLAVSDKKTGGKQFERFLPIIKREVTDNRTYVKKAVNWALRQIGKRNLNRKAIETAKEIHKIDSRSAKWIASDAIRELTSEAVQERLQGKKVEAKK